MISPARTGLARLSTFAAVAGLLAACSSTPATVGAGGLSGTAPAASSGATSGATSPASAPTATVTATVPTYYFGNGKTYDAWIIKVSGSTLTIALVHHLTGKDAENYLTSHGATIPPGGIPDDYINVDTHVHKTVQLSASATATTNEEGSGPTTLSVGDFLTWLAANPAKPLATAALDTYPGAPTYDGPLFGVTFTKDVMVSANQIFEP